MTVGEHTASGSFLPINGGRSRGIIGACAGRCRRAPEVILARHGRCRICGSSLATSGACEASPDDRPPRESARSAAVPLRARQNVRTMKATHGDEGDGCTSAMAMIVVLAQRAITG